MQIHKCLNKKRKSEMENTWLISNFNFNLRKYLNVSIYNDFSHARMAEWLTHLLDIQGLSRHAGSIPAPGVTISEFEIKRRNSGKLCKSINV